MGLLPPEKKGRPTGGPWATAGRAHKAPKTPYFPPNRGVFWHKFGRFGALSRAPGGTGTFACRGPPGGATAGRLAAGAMGSAARHPPVEPHPGDTLCQIIYPTYT